MRSTIALASANPCSVASNDVIISTPIRPVFAAVSPPGIALTKSHRPAISLPSLRSDPFNSSSMLPRLTNAACITPDSSGWSSMATLRLSDPVLCKS